MEAHQQTNLDSSTSSTLSNAPPPSKKAKLDSTVLSIENNLTKKNSVQIDEEENFVDEEPEEEEEDAEEDLMLMHSQINPNSAPKEGENHRVLSEKEARRKLHHMRMLFFVSQLSEDQLNQYESFRRSTFPKALIKKFILQSTKCTTVSQNVLICLSGITKVLVGQIVDEAITLSQLANDTLPLKEKYIRYAYMNLMAKGDISELTQVRDFDVD